MSQIFSAIEKLKDKFKIRLDKVYIENQIFRLFSTVTVGCLFLSCGLVTMQQLIGKHIECILPPKEDVRQEALNQYCFIMSTYTLPHLYNQTVGSQVSHFGVGAHDPTKDEKKYHSYYQWVPFALFFQGLLFLLPHFIWKSYEGGRIKAYCELEMAEKVPMKSRSLTLYNKELKEENTKMINRAAAYFVENMSYNALFAAVYIICEVLNFVIVVSNIFLTDAFLGYEFTKYGPEVLNFISDDPENRIDPMDRVFPKVAKCDFQKYGPSGNIIRYDIMCVLALNIINEKIYVFLWFWFIIVAAFGGLNLIYRLVVFVLPRVRAVVISRKIPVERKYDLESILEQPLSYSDWFVLKRVSDNINRIRFGELCEGINNALTRGSVNGRLSAPRSDYSSEDVTAREKLIQMEG